MTPNLINNIIINKLSKRTLVNELFKRFMETEAQREKVRKQIVPSDSHKTKKHQLNESSDIDEETNEMLYAEELNRQLAKDIIDKEIAALEQEKSANEDDVAELDAEHKGFHLNKKNLFVNSYGETPEQAGRRVRGTYLEREAREADGIQVDPIIDSSVLRSQKLVRDSSDMASKVVHKDTMPIDGNRFSETENTYQNKDNFKSTVNEFVSENSAILLATDNIVKGINYKLGNIAESLNIQVEKSEKLGHDWSIVMKNLQAYRKSLEGVNFQKAILTITASIAVLTFMYKMGVAGKLAKFGLGLISEIGNPSVPNSSPVSPFEGMVEKLKVPDSKVLNNVMENALTPGIIIGVGLTLGTLMMAAKVFKVLRFIIKK